MTSSQTTYTVQRTETESIHITLAAPDLQAEGLHLQTWGSSHLLANRLHRLPVTFPSSPSSDVFPILELGAGTGLVGISAAAIWGQAAMLTDFASIVPGTAANVQHNASLLAKHDGRAACGSLDWNAPKDLVIIGDDRGECDAGQGVSLPSPFSLPSPSRAHAILTADTLYTSEQPALLAGCIDAWLARSPAARAIVCYPLRVAALDAIRDFWARMDALGLEAVQEQQERVEGSEHDWDDERLHEWAVFRWREEVLATATTTTEARDK